MTGKTKKVQVGTARATDLMIVTRMLKYLS